MSCSSGHSEENDRTAIAAVGYLARTRAGACTSASPSGVCQLQGHASHYRIVATTNNVWMSGEPDRAGPRWTFAEPLPEDGERMSVNLFSEN